MKKAYESPKAEKTAFNYSDTVVASGNKCHWEGPFGFEGDGCKLYPAGDGQYVGLEG